MYEVLNKDTTESKIQPHLPVAKRGYALKVTLWRGRSVHSKQVEKKND